MNHQFRHFALILLLIFALFTEGYSQEVKTVSVGLFKGEGYAEQDENGTWHGIDVELIQNIAQTAGFRVSFVSLDSSVQAFADLENGTIDMLADIAKNETREKKYLFSQHEQGNSSSNLFVRENDDRWDYGGVDQIKTMTIAVERGNISISDLLAWCRQYDFVPTIKEYPSTAQTHDAVARGEVDAFVEGDNFFNGFRSILTFIPSPYYFIFRNDNIALKTQVDDAMSQIYIQNPLYENELMERYLNLTGKKSIAFTKAEKEYIASHPEVRIAVLENDEPYFSGTESKPSGVLPEFYNQIAKETGLHFTFKIYETQREALDAITANNADIIGMYSNGISEAYESDLCVTRKYTTVNSVMVTRSGVTSTEHMRIAVKARSANTMLRLLPSELSTSVIVPCNTATECFKQFSAKKVDAMIMGLPSVTYLMNQMNSSSYVVTPLSATNLDLCAVASRRNKILVSILNKGINSVSYAISGIIANNTLPKNTIRTFIARIPPLAIIIFGVIMILLVLLLLFALVAMVTSRKTKLAAERIKANAEEERIRAEIAEKNAEEKTAFFSNISHDMRTPLNAVLGFVRQARKTDVTPELKDEYLSKVELSGNLLLDLINDTLTVSRISSGKLTLHLEPCSTKNIVESIVSPIIIAADQKHIAIDVDISAMPDKIIMADRLNLEKIFLNLLTNAVRYTPEGGHVWFTVVQDAMDATDTPRLSYTITVRDNGIGMSPEYLPHVFEPFSQEKQAGYDSTGTGLGLSIVKQLVILMGGTVQVESIKGKGTTFTVQLNFVEGVKSESAEHKVSANKNQTLAGKKVLLCEDNSLNREIAVALLNEKGIEAVTVADGQQGVQKFNESEKGEYACILMDIRMPVMDGLEATERIRSLNRADAETIPIIAMTANAFADDVQACLDAGMNGHVSKPISPEQLFKTIQEVI